MTRALTPAMRLSSARLAEPKVMEIETLNAMNGVLDLSLLMIIEVIALINILFAAVGFAIYLAGVAWLYFEETRRVARRQMKKPAPEPLEHGAYKPTGVSRAYAAE